MNRSPQSRRLVFIISASLVLSPVMASAQSNPFVPPSRSGGLSQAQVAQIVKREVDRNAPKTTTTTTTTGPNGARSTATTTTPGAPNGVAAIPSQPGVPNGSPLGPGSPIPPRLNASGQMTATTVSVTTDPVEQLINEGGAFVGCVGATPIFKDKAGRRAYFTTKELRNSHEARRFARC